MATRLPTSHNRRMILTSAAVIAVGLGAYGLGRVYPPPGPSAGTIAPAERYVSSQVGDADVTLGDTAVPQLMQTDAFELFVHDPQFRALAASPGFQAIAGNPQVMAALLANPQAFADLAGHPEAFAGLVKAAQNAGSLGSPVASGERCAAWASLPAIRRRWRHSPRIPRRSRAILSDAVRVRQLREQCEGVQRRRRRRPGLQAARRRQVGDERRSSPIPQVFAALSANAGQFKGLSGHRRPCRPRQQCRQRGSPAPGRGRLQRGTPGARPATALAFEQLAAQPKALDAIAGHRRPSPRSPAIPSALRGDPVARLGVQPAIAQTPTPSSDAASKACRRKPACRTMRRRSSSSPPTATR